MNNYSDILKARYLDEQFYIQVISPEYWLELNTIWLAVAWPSNDRNWMLITHDSLDSTQRSGITVSKDRVRKAPTFWSIPERSKSTQLHRFISILDENNSIKHIAFCGIKSEPILHPGTIVVTNLVPQEGEYCEKCAKLAIPAFSNSEMPPF